MLQALNLYSDIHRLFFNKTGKKENSSLREDCISDQASDPIPFREMCTILYVIKSQIFQYQSKLIKLHIQENT